MKTITTLLCSLFLLTQEISQAREPRESAMLVSHRAPEFKAQAIVNGNIVDDFSLQDFAGKYIVFFFYPLDFTFVCPTELHAFQEKSQEFEARNAQVIGCSIDSSFTHLAWLNTPRSSGGIQGVQYPLVSDLNKSIARRFHVLDDTESFAYRGLFLIDREGIIRHELINDLPLGRSVEEVLRLLDALKTYEQVGEVCPANWKPGADTMKPTTQGLIDYYNKNE